MQCSFFGMAAVVAVGWPRFPASFAPTDVRVLVIANLLWIGR